MPGFFQPSVPMSDVTDHLNAENLKKLLDGCRTERDRLLVLFSVRTARREGEVVRVRRCDLNFEDSMVKFSILKKKQETVKWKAVDPETMELLKDYCERAKISGEMRIFPMSTRRVRQIVEGAGRTGEALTVGGKFPSHKTLRHTFCSMAAKRTKNIGQLRALQEYLDHSDFRLTLYYYVTFNSMEDSRELLREMWGE